MVSKFRRKLIIVTTLAVVFVMTIIFAMINLINYSQITSSADKMLTLIAENKGIVPAPPPEAPERDTIQSQLTEESQYQTRYCIVQLNKNNEIIDVNTSHIAAISDTEASGYALEILSADSQSGYKEAYRYKVVPTDFGRIVIFLDCSMQLDSFFSMMAISGMIAIMCSFAIFLVIFMFSKRFIRPMVDNIEKQKRFITDAGHELKTPLAIINANVEVMELMSGKNEWTDSIKNQVTRLDQLVKSMLLLAKMEENTLTPVFVDFDLTKAFTEITEPFEIMAQQQDKKLTIRAQENIRMYGDESAIRNLISILVDNAIKYCTTDGIIEATLRRDGKALKIKVRNSADSENNDNLNRLFDRFYRSDSSRSRESGGFGIGLSMAQTIVDSHKGKISAQREAGGYVSFNVLFKNQQNSSARQKKN